MKTLFAAAAIAATLSGSAQADWILINGSVGERDFTLWVENAYPSKEFCESAIDHARYHAGGYRGGWRCVEVPAPSKWALLGVDPKLGVWLVQAYPDASCFDDIDKAQWDAIHRPSAANKYSKWRCEKIPATSKCNPDDSRCVVNEIVDGRKERE